ncbi:MAG: hypothetical protein AAGA03_18565, partial [Planctomycetota bacterium]
MRTYPVNLNGRVMLTQENLPQCSPVAAQMEPSSSARRTRLSWVVFWLLLAFGSASTAAFSQETATDETAGDEPGAGQALSEDFGETKPQVAEPADDSEQASDEVESGQASLDEAVMKRIDAKSPAQLAAVAELLETALEKGLNKESESFARKMLGSVYLQQGQRLATAMVDPRNNRRVQTRDRALQVLGKAVKQDPKLVEAWLLIGQPFDTLQDTRSMFHRSLEYHIYRYCVL